MMLELEVKNYGNHVARLTLTFVCNRLKGVLF